MLIEELDDAGSFQGLSADLCIIGSGPAGWSIAEELKESGLRILMLESGGHQLDPAVCALNDHEQIGVQLFRGQDRMLGGTSLSWGGRCIPLDAIDYEARDWVALSGWPINGDVIRPYLRRAARLLGADPATLHPVPHPSALLPNVGGDLRHVHWQDTPPIQLGQVFRAQSQRNLHVLLYATVTHLNTDASGRVLQSVEVTDRQGRRLIIPVRAAVLCAGGIQNPRLLLASNRIVPNGVGNGADLVGRYFIDHPRDPGLAVHFKVRDAGWVRRVFGPEKIRGPRGWHSEVRGLALASECQKRLRLLNCAAWPFEIYAQDDPIEAARRILSEPRKRMHHMKVALRQPGFLLRGLNARLRNQRIPHKIARIGFMIASEQSPDRDSRVSLSQAQDRFGHPLARVDWRISTEVRESQAVLAQKIVSEFSRLGLPSPQLADWIGDSHRQPHFVDGCHPSGTTRMADDPRQGVVDANCQVHDVAGLYVAGTSVFPTVGHANPTLMIVALAVRLADKLRQRFGNVATASVSRAEEALSV